ncbi:MULTISPECIES: restriction endonuclease subunit S [Cyanobium]|nr:MULTISPECIES: restriction endonuclease subunit S [Cyanobium]MCP9781463.1 restriction endonuclease subunit S [Cyanobium sp. To12R1]
MNENIVGMATLGECLESVVDYRGKTPPKSPCGIPTITAANVKSGRIDMSTVSYVSEKTYWEWSTRGFPEAADVLITTEAPVGEVAPFPGDQTYLITRRVFAMRGKKGLLDNAYLLYTCLSSIVQDELQSRIRGSTVPRVLKTDILGLQIPLPSIEEQKAIAHILGTLDDKIELNRKTNETLEAIAKALFKSWFVDFDPVRAKAKGLPTGLPAEISDLFPDSFEDSELGEIPSGWEVKALDEIAHFLNGLALQKFPPEDGAATLPVIKIAQLKKGDSTGADRCSTAVPSDYVVRDGDMLFSWSGSLAVDIWCGGDGALNQHLFKVTSKTYAKWFFCLWVKHHLPVFQEIAQGKATTMGHIQRHHLSEAKVLIPPPSLLAAMDSAFTALLDRAFGLRRQSKDLGSIRDALLPKLISGEIRIPDAEKMLEEVGV